MELSNNEMNTLLKKNDFKSPFNISTNIEGFVKDIKIYLISNFADPKSEALDYIKDVIIYNGIEDPNLFLKKFIFK